MMMMMMMMDMVVLIKAGTSNMKIIIIIIITFLTSRLWLGNNHLSWDAVINRIRLGGLICSLESFLQLNICQELQFLQLYIYIYIWGAG